MKPHCAQNWNIAMQKMKNKANKRPRLDVMINLKTFYPFYLWKLFICVFIATLFFCFLWIIVLQHQQHNGNGQHVSFLHFSIHLYSSKLQNVLKSKCMMKLKKEQRYFAVFFSLAILLSASKTPIYDYNT